MTPEEQARLLINEVEQLLMQREHKEAEFVAKRTIRQAQREAFERACKAQCVACEQGRPITFDGRSSYYYHDLGDPDRVTGCIASSIRALINQESKEPATTE